jgi:hypothetical protein
MINDVRSCSERRAEPHFGTVKLPKFCVAEEDAVHIFIHLFEPDLFVPEHFTDEDPTLMPADVSAVVHSPRLKCFLILETRHAAWQHAGAWHVGASRRLVGQSFVRARFRRVEHRINWLLVASFSRPAGEWNDQLCATVVPR